MHIQCPSNVSEPEGQCRIARARTGYLGDEMETSRLSPGYPFGGWQRWAAGVYSRGDHVEGASHLEMLFAHLICRTDRVTFDMNMQSTIVQQTHAYL